MADRVDVLNRNMFIEQLWSIVRILSRERKGCCFGIDGAWGSGKTFVLEEFERRISKQQSEETADNQFYVFHYDCWKYDYYEEPLLAIVIAMLDTVQDKLSEGLERAAQSLWENVKENLYAVMGEACKNKIGVNLLEIGKFVDKIKEDTESERIKIDELSGFRKVLEKTRKEIKGMAEDKTMIIVVDELDRCLPEYSIKVLERLHHIFDGLDNVIVIVSMDKSQLKKSIIEIFGEIDVDIYLRKFIAFKIDLDKGRASMYAQKFASYFYMFRMTAEESEEIEELFADIQYGLDMRTQERIFRKAQIIHEMTEDGAAEDCSIMAFEILYLTVSLKTKQKDFKWLCKMREADDYNALSKREKESIGEKYFETLKKHVYKGIETEYKSRGSYYGIASTVTGKMFFWLSNAFYTYNNGTCGIYYFPNHDEQTKRDVDRVKRFVELIDIVSCD